MVNVVFLLQTQCLRGLDVFPDKERCGFNTECIDFNAVLSCVYKLLVVYL